MASGNTALSKAANGMKNDIDGLPRRLSSYKESLVALDPLPGQEKILHFDAALSVLEGLGAKLIRENVSDNEIDNLVVAINGNKKQCLTLTDEPEELEKIEFNAARTEAALKGFVLPLSISGNVSNLNSYGLDRKTEYIIAMEATKQAILEQGDKHISKDDYAQAVIDRTQEILEQDSRGFDANKLKQFNDFISQGRQISKPSKLSSDELEVLSQAASKSVNHFVTTMEKDQEVIQSVALLENIVKDAISQMEQEHGVQVSPDRVKKITKALVPEIAKLDPTYVENNSSRLTDQIKDELYSNRTLRSKFSKDFRIAGDKLESIAEDIIDEHQPKARAEVAKNIDRVIGRGLTNTTIADRLNEFQARQGQESSITAQDLPTTEEIVEIREANPKGFDKIFSGSKSKSSKNKTKARASLNKAELGPIEELSSIDFSPLEDVAKSVQDQLSAADLKTYVRETFKGVREQHSSASQDSPAPVPRKTGKGIGSSGHSR